ncbi:response regulator [Calothrix sp. FACHB-1219]|uniref:response regulator n=1 Tax=unclassified Calothrix TaxID=2619626 RepID=UPI001686758E|nr:MULTISPECIES: response regulator [unclassified Calothrix]MBD2202355.1 response regulator [Calothrix sp. FACHB-168]MBD2217761.1 response regulator [Calothrix sp. FACHB-1219]
MKILLIEDDKLLSMALAELLTANDYSLDLANNGETGLKLAISGEYDLILLDWLIPKLDGISLCRQLRSQGYQKAILLLSAKNCNADIVAGLDAGADDYVIKPYEPEALLARIRSLLRRSGTIASCKLTWENLCLDQTAAKVTYEEKLIGLTVTEYNLLELFLQNPNRIFSRQVILDRLWGFDQAPVEHAVTTHIKDLRKKLKAAGLKEDILETIYGIGYRLKPAPNRPLAANTVNVHEKESKQPNLTAVNRVLQRFHDSFTQQVELLAQANKALLAGNLSEELRQTAKQEAHKLAGSMGTFGYPEGSQLARKIEQLLLQNQPLTDSEFNNFSQLVKLLQQELTKSQITGTVPTVTVPVNYCVLAIDDDTLLTQRLVKEADNWGMKLEIAPDLSAARSYLATTTPDTVLLDLSFPDKAEDGLTLLRELGMRSPNLPIVVFTGRDSLADRLAVSRLGARQFLHKPATTEQIFQAIARVLPQRQTSEAKVLIVDDDPLILTGLSALLTPWGLEVTTLSEPQHFWEVLITTLPDLVVLDLEMPVVNGLELCQVVRQDAQWGDLPILVVTSHTDAASLQQAFAAGADDFISKPVLGPELVTRVISRIQRLRQRWQPGRAREGQL